MNKDELIKFLHQNLSIELESKEYYGGYDDIIVKLKLCGEEISYSQISLDYKKTTE